MLFKLEINVVRTPGKCQL